MKKLQALIIVVLAAVVLIPLSVQADSSYSSGSYGTCQFNACGISLTTSGAVTANVVPGSGPNCSVSSDSVSVLTDSSTGYTLTLNDNDTANQLTGSSATIAPTTGTNTSPSLLTANKWGYRVDSVSGFGAGPAATVTNGAVPSYSFAGVPLSSSAADTIATSPTAANPAVTTTVWYGVCANFSIPSGTYTDTVVYTAVVN